MRVIVGEAKSAWAVEYNGGLQSVVHAIDSGPYLLRFHELRKAEFMCTLAIRRSI